MKVTLTYEIQVDYVIDLIKEEVESITVTKQTGSPLSGYDGFIHTSSDSNPFTRQDSKRAVEILKTKVHPEWQIKDKVSHG